MKEKTSFSWREWGRWIPGVIISAIAIYAIFHLVSWKDLGTSFRSIRLVFVLPGLLIVFLWLMARALAMKVILSGKPTIWQTFRAINIGYLLNNLLPLRAGEFGKAIILGKSSKLGMSYILSAIVIERAFDLIFAAAFLLVALPFVFEMDWIKPVAIGVLAVVVAGIFLLYLAARNSAFIQNWVKKVGSKWGWVEKLVLPQMESFFTGLQILTNPRQFLLSLVMIGLSWVLAIGLYFIMLYSIVPAPKLYWGIFINSVLAMGIALPSAPAALGVFEASIVAGLKVLGVGYSTALAYAVVMHFLQVAFTGIIGFWSLTHERQSIGSLFSSARKKDSNQETDLAIITGRTE